jgi:hypothetical protein
MTKFKAAIFSLFALLALGASLTPVRASPCTDNFSQIQALINQGVVSGVPGGITASTVNNLLNMQNNCYFNIENANSSALAALSQALNSDNGLVQLDANGIAPAANLGLGELSVTSAVVGMVPNTGFDNSTRNAALMNAISPTIGGQQAGTTIFPAIFGGTGQAGLAEYYYSTGLHLSRNGDFKCTGGPGNKSGASVALIIGAGYDGVVFEGATTSSDGGTSRGELSGCQIYSLSGGYGTLPASGTSITAAGTYGSGTIAATPWAAGDAVMGGIADSAISATLSIPTGAYLGSVSGSVGAQTLNLASGFTITATAYGSGAQLYRLPAALAFSVTTTSGSSTFTVTGGPFLLQVGDWIWSDAFPFGATIDYVTGAVGAQTVNVVDWVAAYENLPATVSHTSGSGKLWKIPALLKHRSSSRSSDNNISGGPIGEQFTCFVSGSTNCTESASRDNSVFGSIIGLVTGGDNSSGSTFTRDHFYNSLYADIAEFATIGNTYVGMVSNSGVLNAVIGTCYGESGSVFLGQYVENTGSKNWPYCATPQVAATLSNAKLTPIFVGPTSSVPTDVPLIVNGIFYTNGQPLESGTAGANSDLTGRVTLSGGTYTRNLTGAGYGYALNCLSQDETTPANVCSVAESTTQLVFTGTGSDVCKYHCDGVN